MVTISGTVTNQDGEALSGVQVYVYDEVNESIAASGTTDASGNYSFTVGSNSYHILFSYEDGSGDQFNNESYPAVT